MIFTQTILMDEDSFVSETCCLQMMKPPLDQKCSPINSFAAQQVPYLNVPHISTGFSRMLSKLILHEAYTTYPSPGAKPKF